MSEFGDYEIDDAYDPSPADPEQVARKLHAIARDAGIERYGWAELVERERQLRIEIVVVLLEWLRRSGAMR